MLPVAAVLVATPLIATANSPTEVELTKAWQSWFDAKRQAFHRDPARNKDPLGLYRAQRTYTKVRSISCQPQVDNQMVCTCDVRFTQEGKDQKDTGVIYLQKIDGVWVNKPQ